jgi:hypothetical protein
MGSCLHQNHTFVVLKFSQASNIIPKIICIVSLFGYV